MKYFRLRWYDDLQLTEGWLTADWLLTDCRLTADWLLTDCWLIAWRFELKRWRLRALDNLSPDRRTHKVTSWAPCRSQKLIFFEVSSHLLILFVGSDRSSISADLRFSVRPFVQSKQSIFICLGHRAIRVYKFYRSL